MGSSNSLIGFLNFLSLLLSLPILAGAIWLSSRAVATECLRFLQWPLIVISISIITVSLAGFAGTCYRHTSLVYCYLWAMFPVIAALLAFVVFAYAVTGKGSGRALMGRAYMDYSLRDYDGSSGNSWLADHVTGERDWERISACVRDSHVCEKMGRSGAYEEGVAETAEMFYMRKLTPIESGCCKPPTSCGFAYVNETTWISEGGPTGPDPDCSRWSNDQEQLCYHCDSCKAGFLASVKRSWRKVSTINIVVLIILILVYIVAFMAFRHNKEVDYDEPIGQMRMEKFRPSRIF